MSADICNNDLYFNFEDVRIQDILTSQNYYCLRDKDFSVFGDKFSD